MFALFEDAMLSCCETAGYVRFALFTSGYGYSPPSATLWQATKWLNGNLVGISINLCKSIQKELFINDTP